EADDGVISQLAATQNGHAGVMTGSHRALSLPRRRRGRSMSAEGGIREVTRLVDPPGLKNLIFLEWFNEENQRILIQSWHLQLRVSPPRWRLEKEEEARLLRANRARRRAFLLRRAQQGRRPDAAAPGNPFTEETPPPLESFDGQKDPFGDPPSAGAGGKQRRVPRRQNGPQNSESELPAAFQRAGQLADELRRFEQLLLTQDGLVSRPALLRLLSTVADLAAHLQHALRQFIATRQRSLEFLIVDLEQSLPLFSAALGAAEELSNPQPAEGSNRWLGELRGSLLNVELRMRELLALLR
ncbi:MAG: hypothetical protein KDK99_19840, partial [Verrucomicrobiales bacterium]|nr:hypothetical protein [Verrucomicrobiales bacterium]